MTTYPIQTNFTTGILSPRFWSRSDVQEYRSGIKDCENMFTTRHGPIQSRNGTTFNLDLGDNYARPFGFQLIPNSVTGEAFTAVVSEDLTLKLVGATGILYEEELNNPSFSVSLDGWDKILTDGLSFVGWSSGSVLITPENALDGAISGITQLVNATGGSENDDRVIAFVSVQQGDIPAIETTISVGTTSGASDLLEFKTVKNSDEVIFNPGGLTSYYISFTCQQVTILPPPEEGVPTNAYGSKTLVSVSSSVKFLC